MDVAALAALSGSARRGSHGDAGPEDGRVNLAAVEMETGTDAQALRPHENASRAAGADSEAVEGQASRVGPAAVAERNDLGANAARTLTQHKAADDSAAPVQSSAALHPQHGALGQTSSSGRRMGLMLAFGIALGAALSSWLTARAPKSDATATTQVAARDDAVIGADGAQQLASARSPDVPTTRTMVNAPGVSSGATLEPASQDPAAPTPAPSDAPAKPGGAASADSSASHAAPAFPQPSAAKPFPAAAPSEHPTTANASTSSAAATASPSAADAPRTPTRTQGSTPASSSAAPVKATNNDKASAPPPAVAADDDSEEGRLARAARDIKSHGEFDSVLDDAFTNPRQSNAAPAPAALAAAPSRDDITKAMAVLVPAIRGCAQGQSGLATAAIVVRGDGRVESVSITGAPFAGTASGRCMEGVVRRARFPRFRQATFRVQFPFAIQ